MDAANGGCVKRTRRRRPGLVALAAVLLMAAAMALPALTQAEQASQPTAPAAGLLDTSSGTLDTSGFTCSRHVDGDLRCWGFGAVG